LAHRLAQLDEFSLRRTTNEILFAQKLIEGEELATIVGAAPVGKPRAALQIVGQRQRASAIGMIERDRERQGTPQRMPDQQRLLQAERAHELCQRIGLRTKPCRRIVRTCRIA